MIPWTIVIVLAVALFWTWYVTLGMRAKIRECYLSVDKYESVARAEAALAREIRDDRDALREAYGNVARVEALSTSKVITNLRETVNRQTNEIIETNRILCDTGTKLEGAQFKLARAEESAMARLDAARRTIEGWQKRVKELEDALAKEAARPVVPAGVLVVPDGVVPAPPVASQSKPKSRKVTK